MEQQVMELSNRLLGIEVKLNQARADLQEIAVLKGIKRRETHEQEGGEVTIDEAISRIKSEFLRLKSASMFDALTGAFNRDQFDRTLKNEFDRAKRYRSPLSLIVLDIDNFKTINDTYGHPIGDRALKNVAQYFKSHIRSTDQVFRYGGDEFCVLVPADWKSAAQLIHRTGIIKPLSFPDVPGSISLSFGLAHCPSPAIDIPEMLFEVADKAMMQQKREKHSQDKSVQCVQQLVGGVTA